jgi:hypothetical protein
MIFQTSRSAKAFFLGEEASPLSLDSEEMVSPAPDGVCVLARGLCRYHHFEPPAGLSGGAAAQAARLYAGSHGPFAQSDAAIFRTVRGYGIWWWDAAALRERDCGAWIYDADRVAPESLLQPVGEGLRLVETSDGYEAQNWQDATLLASTWRRRPFNAEQWAGFVRGLGWHDPAASGERPDVAPRQWLRANLRAAKRIVRPRAAARLQQAAAALLIGCLAAGVGLAAREIHFSRQIAAEEARLAALRAAAAASPDAAVDANRASLEALAERFARPNALFALGEFYKTIAAHGGTPGAVNADDASVRAEVVMAPDRPLEDLARALEESPWFEDVRPETDPVTGKVVVSARLCNAAVNAVCREKRGRGA